MGKRGIRKELSSITLPKCIGVTADDFIKVAITISPSDPLPSYGFGYDTYAHFFGLLPSELEIFWIVNGRESQLTYT